VILSLKLITLNLNKKPTNNSGFLFSKKVLFKKLK